MAKEKKASGKQFFSKAEQIETFGQDFFDHAELARELYRETIKPRLDEIKAEAALLWAECEAIATARLGKPVTITAGFGDTLGLADAVKADKVATAKASTADKLAALGVTSLVAAPVSTLLNPDKTPKQTDAEQIAEIMGEEDNPMPKVLRRTLKDNGKARKHA